VHKAEKPKGPRKITEEELELKPLSLEVLEKLPFFLVVLSASP
jgi:hypothetical protein